MFPNESLRDRLHYRLSYPRSGSIEHWYREKRARRLAKHFRLHRIWLARTPWRPE